MLEVIAWCAVAFVALTGYATIGAFLVNFGEPFRRFVEVTLRSTDKCKSIYTLKEEEKAAKVILLWAWPLAIVLAVSFSLVWVMSGYIIWLHKVFQRKNGSKVAKEQWMPQSLQPPVPPAEKNDNDM